MKFVSLIRHKKARIEIIPLIDIMFFLLASFMMVSLSQVHMKGMKVELPAARLSWIIFMFTTPCGARKSGRALTWLKKLARP